MNNNLIIDVKNLNKYFGNIHAVKDLTISVRKGEIFGFLGPNGSGKTTTIRMLCGLLTPDSGKGHCLNYNILTESRKIKNHVGYMTQHFSYYGDLTITENLEFVARVYNIPNPKQKIADIMEQFDFSERRNQLAGTLSGGWKQRLALAACLLHEPDLLLLDEPTAGVDPEARRQFWDKIHELSFQGITTLVSTHYMDEAERCTRLAYIAYGNLLEQGTSKEIIEHVGLLTYAIEGIEVFKLADFFKTHTQLEQVAMFGDSLHLSDKNSQKLDAAIQQMPDKEKYQINKKAANLEDVFISLVGKARHEKHLD